MNYSLLMKQEFGSKTVLRTKIKILSLRTRRIVIPATAMQVVADPENQLGRGGGVSGDEWWWW